ncbi:MAG: hydrogenase, partial [Nitrospirae bacterium]|nr:hydrogenase [Nitrospirota bacterium]
MLRILHQIFRTGIVTEPLPRETEAGIEIVGDRLEKEIGWRFHRSLTIRLVDAGSCNGCELEIHA